MTKKHIAALVVLSCFAHGAWAQEVPQEEPAMASSDDFVKTPNWMIPRLYLDDDNILRREISLYLHGGLAPLEYSTSLGGLQSGLLHNLANTYDYIEYLSIGGGLSYTYFFTPIVGLTFGVEGTNYKGFVEAVSPFKEQFEEFIPALDLNDGTLFQLESQVTNDFRRYEERQSTWYLQIPLMVQLNPNLRKGVVKFAASFGLKAGMQIIGSHEQQTRGSTAIYIDKPYLQNLTNVGHGTGAFSQYSSESMTMKFNATASLELGVRWRLAPEYALYTSIFADYGFLNIAATSDAQQQNYIRTFDKEIQNSIINSRYTNRVSSFAVGLKLRFSLGKLVLSEAGEERIREMTKSYVRVLARGSNNNQSLPMTLKYAMNNSTKTKIDSFIYDLDDATFRIPLPKNSDYSIAFEVELPDYAKPDSVIVEMLASTAANSGEFKFDAKNSGSPKTIIDESLMSYIKILLINKKTGAALPAVVRVLNMDNEDIDSANTINTGGIFYMKTQPGTFHRLVFVVNVSSPPIPFKKVKTGAKITMKGIFFDTNSAQLTQQIKNNLKELIDFLKAYPELRIEVSGHTDNKGNKDKNQKISEKRAKAIVDYLAEQGVAASRLEAKGYGDKRPVASNKTSRGRSKNRRVEVKIIK